MRLLFCGTRGSTPAPGRAHLRYGGHTSCIAIGRGAGPPALLLDGGTGLAQLDERLAGEPFAGSILLSHLHWDHTHGLPFFGSGAAPGHRVEVFIPEQGDDAEAVLARAFSPPHFPIEPQQLGNGWRFRMLPEGERDIEGYSVLALEIPHKGGRTFGFRVSDETTSLAYLPDHHPLALGPGPIGIGELHPNALALARDVDLLIHDAQYLVEELPELAPMGHSCGEYAVSLAEAAGAREVCLYHHAPRRTDDALDELAGRFTESAVPTRMAFDGLVLTLADADRAGVTSAGH